MSEQRLIDADKLKQNLNGSIAPYWIYPSVTKVVDEQPTIDAVQVVRCKDCKHRDEEYTDQFGGIWCDMHGEVEISKNYFCASGEQKDGEQE